MTWPQIINSLCLLAGGFGLGFGVGWFNGWRGALRVYREMEIEQRRRQQGGTGGGHA